MTNYFPRANDYLQEHLGYHLDPDHADDFRQALQRAGWKRFAAAVATVKPWRTPSNAQASHQHLLRVLRHSTPPKPPGTKYRNPQVQAAVKLHRELDARVLELARDPRQ